jgi:hypothetical protein
MGPRRKTVCLGPFLVFGLIYLWSSIWQDVEWKVAQIPGSGWLSKSENQKSSWRKLTRTIVMSYTRDENIDWANEAFLSDKSTSLTAYAVDTSEYRTPKNKGNEVMGYLTYIIDHYNQAIGDAKGLSDVNIFVHSHEFAWHNNELSGLSMRHMLAQLSLEHVYSSGYFNLRCDWRPGCPAWLNLTAAPDPNKMEQIYISQAWRELFAEEDMPALLGQPCCGQFAVSGERIRSIPIERYISYRDWLLHTSLSDAISGRVWEYFWQYVFTRQQIVCPEPSECYCRGYGICFANTESYDGFWDKWADRGHAKDELRRWQSRNPGLMHVDYESVTVSEKPSKPIEDHQREEAKKWQAEITRLDKLLDELLEQAKLRAQDLR